MPLFNCPAKYNIPKDDMVHPYYINNKKILVNYNGECWDFDNEGGCGNWLGNYYTLDGKDIIDARFPEPLFYDEEELSDTIIEKHKQYIIKKEEVVNQLKEEVKILQDKKNEQERLEREEAERKEIEKLKKLREAQDVKLTKKSFFAFINNIIECCVEYGRENANYTYMPYSQTVENWFNEYQDIFNKYNSQNYYFIWNVFDNEWKFYIEILLQTHILPDNDKLDNLEETITISQELLNEDGLDLIKFVEL